MNFKELVKVIDTEYVSKYCNEEQAKEIGAKIDANLDGLSDYVYKHYNIDASFSGRIEKIYDGTYLYKFESQDLMQGAIVPSAVDWLLFKKIVIESFSGGNLMADRNYVVWGLHFSYEHLSGGRNGHELPGEYETVVFDIESGAWFSRKEAAKKYGWK